MIERVYFLLRDMVTSLKLIWCFFADVLIPWLGHFPSDGETQGDRDGNLQVFFLHVDRNSKPKYCKSVGSNQPDLVHSRDKPGISGVENNEQLGYSWVEL